MKHPFFAASAAALFLHACGPSTSCPAGMSLRNGRCESDDASTMDASPDVSADAPVDTLDGSPIDGRTDASPDACTPTGTADLPDPDFADSNCDGIDGDALRAVFVAPSASGGDAGGGMGTRTDPFRRVSDGVGEAMRRGPGTQVLVASGDYADRVMVTSPVILAGGYDATTWRRSASVTRVTGACPVLVVDRVSGGVEISAMDFTGADATMPGASCIAATVVNSPMTALVDVRLRSGH